MAELDRGALEALVRQVLLEKLGAGGPSPSAHGVKKVPVPGLDVEERHRLDTGRPGDRVWTRDLFTLEESPRLELLVHFEPGQLSWALNALEQGGGGRRELSPCETLEETVELARERGASGVLTLENGVERLVLL